MDRWMTNSRACSSVADFARYRATLDWYLRHLGLIVSDFLYYAGQRDRGPVMSFIRCDRGPTPTDHHTLALVLGPADRYVHSAYQVADLDALAAGGEYLRERGYRRSWGIGRHIQGSQIFDYWRDPDGFLVEHFTDGDLFDATLEPGWAPMSASGLAQWGPRATKDFLGIKPGRESLGELRALASALRADNEFDLQRLRDPGFGSQGAAPVLPHRRGLPFRRPGSALRAGALCPAAAGPAVGADELSGVLRLQQVGPHSGGDADRRHGGPERRGRQGHPADGHRPYRHGRIGRL